MDKMEGKLDMIVALLEAVDFSSHGKSTNARKSIWMTNSSGNTSMVTQDCNDAAAEWELPAGWKKHLDSASGKPFFQNIHTHETQWDWPDEEAV